MGRWEGHTSSCPHSPDPPAAQTGAHLGLPPFGGAPGTCRAGEMPQGGTEFWAEPTGQPRLPAGSGWDLGRERSPPERPRGDTHRCLWPPVPWHAAAAGPAGRVTGVVLGMLPSPPPRERVPQGARTRSLPGLRRDLWACQLYPHSARRERPTAPSHPFKTLSTNTEVNQRQALRLTGTGLTPPKRGLLSFAWATSL